MTAQARAPAPLTSIALRLLRAPLTACRRPRAARPPGYFIEKSVDEAQAFLSRKMGLIESQAQNVQSAAQFKQQNLQGTVDVMNKKIMEMRGGGGSSGGSTI